MNIRQSVFGEVALLSEGKVTGIDLGVLLRRLLLFETVVLKSIRLQEVSFLVRTFGKTGLSQLLSSGILKISRESTCIIFDRMVNGVRELPLSHFSFGVLDIAHRENVLRSELIPLQGIPGLKNVERGSLEDMILTLLVRPPADYGAQIQAQLESDLRNNAPALKAAVTQQAKLHPEAIGRPLEVKVEETDKKVFHIITNLTDALGISDQQAHDILKKSVSAVANLNQRLADMQAYSAITGFTESEAPLLFGKLAGIVAPQNPGPAERQFARVLSIANLPEFPPGKRIDVDALLKARGSPECHELRAWLLKFEDMSDSQIADMVCGIKNKIAAMIRTDVGKTMRFAATTAAGLIPGIGMATGLAAGVIDTFLVEQVFPSPGVLAFLTDTYPSLFVSP
ncbi:MAG: hypothetical protein WBD87_01975 [Candidatus Acidiferrales bacterium]